MKEVGIAEFRVKCCAILNQVHKTRRPIRVTRYGAPLAEIVPAVGKKKKRPANWLGGMAGTVKIVGDIVGPTGSISDWEAER